MKITKTLVSRTAVAALATTLMSGATFAQSDSNIYSGLQAFSDLVLPDVSQITIGAGPSFGPDYFGSDDYEFRPKAALYIKFDKYLTLENDGASLNLLGLSNFQFGPVAHFTPWRNEDENPVLNGLGDIDASLDFGLYAKVLVAKRFSARLRLFNDLLKDDNGAAVELSLNAVIHQSDNFSLLFGVTGSWIDDKRAQRFFGVTANQALASGLPEFRPGTSFQDVRADIGARWELSDKWAVNAYGRYSRLLGDIKDSPLVDTFGSENQFTVGTFITRTFAF